MGFLLPCFSRLLWHKAYHRRVRKSTKDFWYRVSFFRVASYCYKHLKNTSDTAENTTWMAQPSHKLSHFHQNSTNTPFSAPPRTVLPVGVWPHWWRLTTPMLFPASIYSADFFSQIKFIFRWQFFHFHTAIFLLHDIYVAFVTYFPIWRIILWLALLFPIFTMPLFWPAFKIDFKGLP